MSTMKAEAEGPDITICNQKKHIYFQFDTFIQ